MVKRIGIIGLGNVGQATVRSLIKYSSLITRRTSLKIEIKGLCDSRKEKGKFAAKFSLPFTTDALQLINDPDIDIIVELIGGHEPAKTFIIQALKSGKNVVTANKSLLAACGREIFGLGQKYNKAIGFEASVCGAIPLIQSISEGLVSCQVNKIYGILNGTTNYILYQMAKEKIDFSTALREAQAKGFAEKNPSLDIEGKDTLHKLCILCYLCFGIWPDPAKVYTEGISNISLVDVLYAQELDYRIKLLAVAERERGKLNLRVHPTFLSEDHPLSETSLAFNSVFLDTEPAGNLLFYGLGAGGSPTSSSVVSDIVSISLDGKSNLRKEMPVKFRNIDDTFSRYYVRFMAQDKPGVLARISKILSSYNISIASVSQKERGRKKTVPIIIITHDVKERNMKKALAKIDSLPEIKYPSQKIRIENL